MTFVHTSVQEFYSSRYIRGLPEERAKHFYEQLLSEGRWKSWRQELLFLEQMDGHRVRKYFTLPDLRLAVAYIKNEDDAEIASREKALVYLSSLSVKKSYRTSDQIWSYNVVVKPDRPSLQALDALDARIFGILFSNSPEFPSWRIGFDNNPTSFVRSYEEISSDRGNKFREILIQKTVLLLTNINVRMESLEQEIIAADQVSTFDSLDDIFDV